MKTPIKHFRSLKRFDIPTIEQEILEWWEQEDIFQESLNSRKDAEEFVFYEGPPSANGLPGIHHVMARTIKDLFCRYKTQKGFLVNRKGGWDTHGLPVELQVEKKLGITKEDIGKSISIEEYNNTCRTEVMKYKDIWDDLTHKMGYWVDLDHPYITFDNNYIETLWYLLKRLFDKGLLYKGYSIQPYSPAAGTGLSSHELNLPGAYRDVKDTSAVAQFELSDKPGVYFIAWTTTPWTLPSNTALAVGKKIEYTLVQTFNPYTLLPIKVYLAKERVTAYFNEKAGFVENGRDSAFDSAPQIKTAIPWRIIETIKGKELLGIRYQQLMPYVQPDDGDAFKVIAGDFVTTEDGTGIVHIAPSFGADDLKVARENGIGSLTLVDKQGKFVNELIDYAGRYVKDYRNETNYQSVDIDICVDLKKQNKAFKIEKFNHSYPHCWRTDKPIIYYPLDSWFVKTTALKERMMDLNKTINWQPEFTGTGRFGNWLGNLVDWNLSRSRFWGTPLPIWITEDGSEIKCIGSIEELKNEIELAVKAGFMEKPINEEIDLHRPWVDTIVLKSQGGKPMKREPDLIDVWFDSGAMPYAQWHYPFENKDKFENNFPADFIAEGVDQTRGWFFTLHALGVLLFDSVAYKNVLSNGLVLDKNGNKMSKRLGNAADPFKVIQQFGADALRWYMMENSQPWDNLKFDEKGINEVSRKFFGTLFNTYSFFSLYANIDGFNYNEADIEQRPEIDQWILSLLNTLIRKVDGHYDQYEPTKAARAIQEFTIDHLSNWYVRLSRRRFWKGEYNEDKISAYQTLFICLDSISRLIAPISPFSAEFLFRSLQTTTAKDDCLSVHLAHFPDAREALINPDLEERMQWAQDFSSMILSLRKKSNIKVRQPLRRVLIPVLNPQFKKQVQKVAPLIKSEVNVKLIEFVEDTDGMFTKKIKPDFKILGRKLGKKMKTMAGLLNGFSQKDIQLLINKGYYDLDLQGESYRLRADEVEISTEDIPGWLVSNYQNLTVALDIKISPELKAEGIARELVNKIQRLRKEQAFNITDRIVVELENQHDVGLAIKEFKDYICTEILATDLKLLPKLEEGTAIDINDTSIRVNIYVNKK